MQSYMAKAINDFMDSRSIFLYCLFGILGILVVDLVVNTKDTTITTLIVQCILQYGLNGIRICPQRSPILLVLSLASTFLIAPFILQLVHSDSK